MDPNAGRFVSDPAEALARGLSVRIAIGEILKLKGVDFRVVEIDDEVDGRGEVRLRMLSERDRELARGGGFAIPDYPPPLLNRKERRAKAARARRKR